MAVLCSAMFLMATLVLNADTVRGTFQSLSICSTCDRTGFKVLRINATCSPLIIHTPNFGRGNYSNNSNCTLVLQSGHERLALSFKFSHFQVERSPRCVHDYLCLNGSGFCGNWSPRRVFHHILPPHTNFTIFFGTNYLVTSSGFQIIVSSKLAVKRLNSRSDDDDDSSRESRRNPRPGNSCRCSIVSSGQTGRRGSPMGSRSDSRSDSSEIAEFRSDYAEGNIQEERYVEIPEFIPDYIEGYIEEERYVDSSEFRPDSSEAFTGNDNSENLWIPDSYGRALVPPPLPDDTPPIGIITNTATTIQHPPGVTEPPTTAAETAPAITEGTTPAEQIPATSETATYDGPTRIYTMCEPFELSIVDVSASTQPFIVLSPNFGIDYYPEYLSCVLTLRSGNQPLIITLDYSSFDVEPEIQCNWDSLCVHGVSLCGAWLSGLAFQYILPENSSFSLNFNTDYSEGSLGFEIQVFLEPAANQQVYELTGGFGSDSTSVSYTPSTYHPGYVYSDRCGPPALTPPSYSPEPTTTATPVPYHETSTRGPVTYPETSTRGPVTYHETSTGRPVTYPETITRGPVTYTETSITGPVKYPENNTTGPVTHHETSTTGPVTNSDTSTTGHVTYPETSTTGPVAYPETSTRRSVIYHETSNTEPVTYPETTAREAVTYPETTTSERVTYPETSTLEHVTYHETSTRGAVANSETSITVARVTYSSAGAIVPGTIFSTDGSTEGLICFTPSEILQIQEIVSHVLERLGTIL